MGDWPSQWGFSVRVVLPLALFTVSVPLSQDTGTTGSTPRRYSQTCSGEVVRHITEPFGHNILSFNYYLFFSFIIINVF